MINMLSLLAAAALLLLPLSVFVNAQLENSKMDLDNNLQPNVIPSTKKSFKIRKHINITQPPPETLEIPVGREMELTCEVLGSPAPAVLWLKNGEPVDEYEDESNELIPLEPSTSASATSILIVRGLVPNTQDVYTCIANNGFKKKTASTTVYTVPAYGDEGLLTLQKLFKIPMRPRIVFSYQMILQNMGSDALLPCRVRSYQKAQIFWRDRDNNLIYGNNRMRVLPSGELFIKKLTWDDMGGYTCTVKNMYGKDSNSTFLYPLQVR